MRAVHCVLRRPPVAVRSPSAVACMRKDLGCRRAALRTKLHAALGTNAGLQCFNLLRYEPPWPNGQGVGPLIRKLRVRVPQGVQSPRALQHNAFSNSALPLRHGSHTYS